jgi:hypothetical protein
MYLTCFLAAFFCDLDTKVKEDRDVLGVDVYELREYLGTHVTTHQWMNVV